MQKSKSGWMVVVWAVVTLILADHLFDTPGLISRHHQGYLGMMLGPWFTWVISIILVLFSAFYTVVTTKNWWRGRQVEER
jgi:hypothetical protein